MRILSFDTSTANLYACLIEGEHVLSEQILISNPDHRQFAASLIMPTLTVLLQQANWQKSDLEAIVVGVGPGGFTGTRIAVVTARTLSQSLYLPLLGISRFECYAFSECLKESPSIIVLSAGKKQYFAALLSKDSSSSGLSWDMIANYFTEENLLSYLQDYKHIYIESEAATALGTSNQWRLLPDLSNPAIIQAKLANQKLSTITGQIDQTRFPYQSIKPLYIRNASVTIKSST